MMLGNLPPFSQAKNIGAAPEDTSLEDIKKLQAEVKWMKWAIILLVAYIIYKETK
jgi:hypothetical protein